MIRPLLIFGYGNPGRGDDGLGTVFVDAVNEMNLKSVECQVDMQLQVEHVTDLADRKIILFVDADASCQPPFKLSEISAEKDESYTSHAMTPQAVLHAYSQVYKEAAPVAFLLRIRGDSFELGDDISPAASSRLNLALKEICPLCDLIQPEQWRAFVMKPAEVAYA